tara:strand:+ start:105 stop:767 length:663 start_codon:yes stop_codon:yes gene_type:complete
MKKKLNNTINIKQSENNIDYFESIEFMQRTVDDIINEKSKDLIWFLNHNHIYTCGTSAEDNEIIKKTNIPIVKSNRGGKTTYHGPGQRIVYLMIDLNKRKKDVRQFVNLLENTVIEILNSLDIEAETFKNRIGIWVVSKNGKSFLKEKKIGAIGLRLKKWVTYHGLSFNINPDLKLYNNIYPCGLKNYGSTSLKDLGVEITTNQFDEMFKTTFIKNLKKF